MLTLERQQFEKWWETAMHNGYPPRFGWEHWRDGDGYRDDDGEFQGLWQAWQASRGFLANREAQPVALDVIARFKEWNTGFPVENFKADYVIGWVLANYYAPPAPANAVAWEMRYWNSGHNCWHDWERITAEQHAEMSAEHAADNDYEFRVLYAAPPAPAVVKLPTEFYSDEGIVVRLEEVMAALAVVGVQYERKANAKTRCEFPASEVPEEMTGGIAMSKYKVKKSNYAQWVKGWNACRAAMLAAAPEGGNDHDAGR
ncbi:hypothetical protein ROX22_003433 [Serratia marcescens]|nr:hypothetical protein [Serratia marcescens]